MVIAVRLYVEKKKKKQMIVMENEIKYYVGREYFYFGKEDHLRELYPLHLY